MHKSLRLSFIFLFVAATAVLGQTAPFDEDAVVANLDPLAPRINEFVARPADGVELDEDGDSEDWIEIFNPGNAAINLGGYYLTDDVEEAQKWAFPAISLAAGDYLRVFASGKDRTADGGFLHTNFSLRGGGEYLALNRDGAGGVLETVIEFSPEYPEQFEGLSYGFSTDGGILGFFRIPTPGAENGIPFDGFVDDTEFSVDRGFFTEPFMLAITTETPGATIRYTLDGSEPTMTNGLEYMVPFEISSTTILRAFAFRDGFEPTNVDSQSYFFPDDLWNQFADGAAPVGWPTGMVNDQVFNYGMDPDVTGVVGREAMIEDLMAIPTMSVAIDQDDFDDPVSGFFVNAMIKGRAFERPVSLELVDPNGSEEEFQVDCGIRIRGGFSRRGLNPKHAFRFYFRDEYGPSKLEFPLFGTEGVTEFDRMDLRTAANYSWSSRGDNTGPQNTFLREVLGRDLQGQTGEPYTRSRYYHLYFNGVYWGLFMTQERVDDSYAESYLGGDSDDYDVVKSTGRTAFALEASSGSAEQGTEEAPGSAWARLWFLSRAQNESPTRERYFEMQGLDPSGVRDESLPVLLDVDNLINYMLMIGYTGNYDAPVSFFDTVRASNNWFGIRDRETNDAGFQFFVHDGEHSLGATNNGRWEASQDRINTENGASLRPVYEKSNPYFLHRDIAETEEYQLRFGDLAHAALFNDGILATENVLATLAEREMVVDQVIDAESARWGDSRVIRPLGRSNWLTAVADLKGVIDGSNQNDGIDRNERFLGHLRLGGLYPMIDAPAFNTGERRLARGSSVNLSAEEGLVYYTIDGSDPREMGGGISPSAFVVDGRSAVSPVITTGSSWSFLDDGSILSGSDVVVGAAGYNLTDWKHPDFDDSAWMVGQGPFGFGRVTDLDINTELSNEDRIVTYFRTNFTVDDPSLVTGVLADFVRDDGVVVYLNGEEVLRENFDGFEGVIDASVRPDNALTSDENDVITASFDPSLLVAGENQIAIQLHNTTASSNDLGIDFRLSLAVLDAADGIAVDEPTEILSRAFDAESGEWSALNAGIFNVGSVPTNGSLIITEVNYNPGDPSVAEREAGATDSDNFEFIELTNISNEVIDLSGVAFIESLVGLDIEGMAFTFPEGASIAPRSSLVLVNNEERFAIRYPNAGVFAEYQGGLANGGEQLVLIDAEGLVLASFTYDDEVPWPIEADGGGATLELAQVGPNQDYADPGSWVASAVIGGSPGLADVPAFMGDPALDEDDDGVSALLEFFAGTSDNDASSFDLPEAVTVEVGGQRYGAIRFRHVQLAGGLGFEVQSSATLNGDWATNGVEVSVDFLADGRMESVYRQSQPLSDGGKNFFRVQVTQQ